MKNTSWLITGLKAWGYMTVAIIICFMLALFFGLDNVIVKILIQIADLLIFGGLVYRYFWNAGSKYSNKVELKLANEDPTRGIKAGIAAASPYVFFWLALLIAKAAKAGTGIGDPLIFIYSFLNVPFAPIINPVFFGFGNSYAATSITSIVLTLFSALFVTGVAYIAYRLGYKQYILLDHIVYKDPTKKS